MLRFGKMNLWNLMSYKVKKAQWQQVSGENSKRFRRQRRSKPPIENPFQGRSLEGIFV